MKHITFYLDFSSPYAYLAFEVLPQALMGHSYSISYKPVLSAEVLKHHGQLGPDQMAGQREWACRRVAWLAQQNQVGWQLPLRQPFNPLGLLRLAVASGADGLVNRFVCETVFRHVWQGGADAADRQRLEALTLKLSPERDPDSEAVKVQLKSNTEEAIANGVFEVPTFDVDGKLFCGFDALPMLVAYLRQDPWFASDGWHGAGAVAVGAQ